MNSILQSSSFNMIYNAISYNKPKGKIDTILEPLQSMIQLALLSICPIGTKLRIQENILYLQSPTLIQPLARWYSVIKRFIKWYNPATNKNSPVTPDLYQLILSMSIEGLNNLFKTYSSSDSNTVIHVIQMYKNLLEYNNDKLLLDEFILDSEKNKINIDEVFEKIICIYDQCLLNVVYNILLLVRIENDMSIQTNIIDGLNLVMNKAFRTIKEWIQLNLVL